MIWAISKNIGRHTRINRNLPIILMISNIIILYIEKINILWSSEMARYCHFVIIKHVSFFVSIGQPQTI